MSTPTPTELRNLARFRHALRLLLRAGEDAAREVGLTPQHHQLLLGIAGHSGDGKLTITDLAEFMQLRHHSTVGLVDRAEALGLVRRLQNPDNKREVIINLTSDGARKLRQLSDLHRSELNFMRRRMDILGVEETSRRGPGMRGATRAKK
ncbi:MAG: MarR family transcriptional regulator [Deltaproteobacteria bacterium]|nr:MarR family transcriptional regulator [Deltaproteobacteria bacterium]